MVFSNMHKYIYLFILTIFLSACSNIRVDNTNVTVDNKGFKVQVDLLDFVEQEKRSGEFIFAGASKVTLVLPSDSGFPSNQLNIPAIAFKIAENIDILNINGSLDLIPSQVNIDATATVKLYLVKVGELPLSGTPLTKLLSLGKRQSFSFGIEDIKNNSQMLAALKTGNFVIAVAITLETAKPSLDIVTYELTNLNLLLQIK